jgi:hypothetical protein
VFCFDLLSGNAAKILTLTKKARGERVTCYDKLHPGWRDEELLSFLFVRSPRTFEKFKIFAALPDKTAKQNGSRRAL